MVGVFVLRVVPGLVVLGGRVVFEVDVGGSVIVVMVAYIVVPGVLVLCRSSCSVTALTAFDFYLIIKTLFLETLVFV